MILSSSSDSIRWLCRTTRNEVLVDHTVFHDELNLLQQPDVFERVAPDRHNIRKLSRFNGANAARPAHQFRWVRRPGLNRMNRSHSELYHGPELATIFSVRIDSRICTQRHPHPAAKSLGHILFCGWGYHGNFFPDPRRKVHLWRVLFEPEQWVRGRYEECFVLIE